MNQPLPISRIRKPVRRKDADRYILITLFSFAASVAATRLFLEITGYPQVGGGELHIAHVLWGGILLFIGAMFPLILANRWSFMVSAVITGLGVGLFMDEIGKFITQTNNYFYPAAAPIIYAFFLLVVFLYTRIRRLKSEDARTQLYIIFDDLQEVLDHDLSDDERDDIIKRLQTIKQNGEEIPLLADLVDNLETFVNRSDLVLAPHQPDIIEQWLTRWQTFETRWLTQSRLRAIMTGSLYALGAWAIIYPAVLIFNLLSPVGARIVINNMVTNQFIRSLFSLNWFEARLGFEVAIGIIWIISAILITLKRDRRGTDLAYAGLVISLTIINLLVFYYDQFSTILNASVQVLVLLSVLSYRYRFLRTSLGR